MSTRTMMLSILDAGAGFGSDLGMYGMASYQATLGGLQKATGQIDPRPKIEDMAEAQATVAFKIAQPHIMKVLMTATHEIASQIGSMATQAVAGVASSMGTVIPMAGAVIEWYSAMSDSIKSAKAQANANMLTAAVNNFQMPYPSGISLVPADLFYPMPDVNNILDSGTGGAANLVTEFGVGFVLAITTEGAFRKWFIPPTGNAATGTLTMGQNLRVRVIPPFKRAMLRQLREAIASSRLVEDGDGGCLAWPIYLDIIMSEVYAGRLTEEVAYNGYKAWLGNYAQVDEDSVDAEGIGNHTENLGEAWSGPYHTIFGPRGLLYAWHIRSYPTYAQDKAAVATAYKVLKMPKPKTFSQNLAIKGLQTRSPLIPGFGK